MEGANYLRKAIELALTNELQHTKELSELYELRSQTMSQIWLNLSSKFENRKMPKLRITYRQKNQEKIIPK